MLLAAVYVALPDTNVSVPSPSLSVKLSIPPVMLYVSLLNTTGSTLVPVSPGSKVLVPLPLYALPVAPVSEIVAALITYVMLSVAVYVFLLNTNVSLVPSLRRVPFPDVIETTSVPLPSVIVKLSVAVPL